MDVPGAWREDGSAGADGAEDEEQYDLDVPPPDYVAGERALPTVPPFDAGLHLAPLPAADRTSLRTLAGSVPPPPAAVAVSAAELGDSFFDIAPSADATSFQVGYLGLPGFRAWIKGDVLVKLDEATRASRRFSKW